MPAPSSVDAATAVTRRRDWLLGAGALLAAQTVPAASTAGGSDAEWTAAVERTAYQRALSQRVAKAYLMLALDVEPVLARRILDDASATFERQLGLLRAAPPSADAARLLAQMADRWADCRRPLLQPPSRAGGDVLYRASDALQEAAHRVLLAYEQARPGQALRGVLQGGRLRMLSERMAKFWLYHRWGLHAEPARMELHLARAHFTALMLQVDRLGLGPGVAAAVAGLRGSWSAYDRLLMAEGDTPAAVLVQHSEANLAAAQALVDRILAPAR